MTRLRLDPFFPAAQDGIGVCDHPPVSEVPTAAIDAVDAIFDRFFAGHGAPGVAYGIVVDGELVHDRGLGTLRTDERAEPDADSVFRIASMTKSFTAATVLLLRDEGRLRLDDPVARWVPELEAMRPLSGDAAPLTIESLLTMSGGLPTDDPWGDRQQDLDPAAFLRFLEAGPTPAGPSGRSSSTPTSATRSSALRSPESPARTTGASWSGGSWSRSG